MLESLPPKTVLVHPRLEQPLMLLCGHWCGRVLSSAWQGFRRHQLAPGVPLTLTLLFQWLQLQTQWALLHLH